MTPAARKSDGMAGFSGVGINGDKELLIIDGTIGFKCELQVWHNGTSFYCCQCIIML